MLLQFVPVGNAIVPTLRVISANGVTIWTPVVEKSDGGEVMTYSDEWGSQELAQDIEYLRERIKELIDDGREWFAYGADYFEWTDPKYCHQN